MPKFESVKMEELKKTIGVSPQRMKKLEQYMRHLSKLSPEMGCKVTCDRGENINTVRNNLKKAAQILGTEITTRRSGNIIVVYLSEGKRRGRRRREIELASNSFQTMLDSEHVLRRDWERPEEEAAWAHL